ncbi:MAG: ABC transporter permease [Candidatus Hodarchaeota archaeon]
MVELIFNREIFEITLLSLRVSGTAVLIAACIGIPAGTLIALNEFPGKNFLRTIINTLMGLPPVLVGLLVVLLFSRSGPFGQAGILFTPTAMIIAQLILTLPIVTGITTSAIASVDERIRDTSLSLGADSNQCTIMIFKEAKLGIMASVIAAFGAAISEVGAVILAGGNIRFKSRVLTTAIVEETGRGNFGPAMSLGIILLTIAFIVNLLLTYLQRR